MSKIRQELMDLSKECEARCEEFGWLSKARVPNYHLLYSSVETYEHGNELAILGINPAGGPEDADTDDLDRAYQEPGYNAYLDDDWRRNGRGQSDLQRAIQAIAMGAGWFVSDGRCGGNRRQESDTGGSY